jgi:predicted kinase
VTRLIVLRGLPGAGKTTRARELTRARRGQVGMISRDTVREHVFGLTMQPEDHGLGADGERLVTAVVDATIETLLTAGVDAIVDATNLRPQDEEHWWELAAQHGAVVEIVDLNVPVEECIARDARRAADGGRYVGPEAIRRLDASR